MGEATINGNRRRISTAWACRIVEQGEKDIYKEIISSRIKIISKIKEV